MSEPKLKIEFRPRRISGSKSKQKYSPYRSKQKKGELDQILQENKQRLALNEPIIRFRRHIESNGTKNKLKLTHQDRKPSPTINAQITVNERQIAPPSTTTCANCQLLLIKIEEQTILLKQNLKEINNTLKLPKIAKSQNESPINPNYENYAENQKIIIAYLDQIKQRGEDLMLLKHTQKALEREIQTLRSALTEWQVKGRSMQMELDVAKMLLEERRQDNSSVLDGKSIQTQDAATSSCSINPPQQTREQPHLLPSEKDEMKLIMTEIMERHSFDFQKIMNELQQIKLENEMLREEVKLLNYAMDEKDAKINVLKNELVGFMQSTRKSRKKSFSSSAKSMKQNTQKSKKSRLNSVEISIQCIPNSQDEDSVDHKKTSILFNPKNVIFNKMDSHVSQKSQRIDDSSSQYYNIRRGKTMPMHSLHMVKRACSLAEEDKLAHPKPFLKLNNKESLITKHEKEQLDKEKKELMYFSEGRLRDLDLIRRTLGHHFKGFKFTFQELQTQMLAREDYEIASEEMDKLLSEYPFLLEARLRQVTLEYIWREGTLGARSMPIDLFCNRLRELLADYDDTEQEQELLLVEKLKKKIYMHLDGILSECTEMESVHGLVSEQNLLRVLQQFKLSRLEKEMFINQCSLLSADADHLDYRQYLSIFQAEQ